MSAYLQQQIEDRMKIKNLTIYALEKKAGLNRSAVRNILQGFSKNPSVEILSAIAEALDCTLNDLVAPTEGNRTSFKSANKVLTQHRATYAWNEGLYLDAVKTISKLAADKGSSFSLEKITNLINEAYKYSISKDSDIVDKDFCKWLVNKSF
jgi:transcriptional regulator with XRE-family HTH domain